MTKKQVVQDVPTTLVYDDDCGNCVRFKRLVELFDQGRRLRYTSIRDAEGRGLLDVLPSELRRTSFHLIAVDGVVESGSAAIPTLLGLLMGRRRLGVSIGNLPGAMTLFSTLYATASSLHETGSCRRESGIESDLNRNRVR